MNKGLTITLIVFLSVLTLSLVAGLTVLLKSDFKFENINFDDNLSTNLVEEKEINDIKDLDINTDLADIIIEGKDIDNIKVELYSNNVKDYEITDGDVIKVVLKEREYGFFKIGRKTPNVKIYLPTSYSNSIKTNSNAGDTRVKGIKDASINIKSDVGDLKVDKIDKANITSRVGDVRIKKVNELVVDSNVGDIKIDEVNNIVSKSKTGDVRIKTINDSLDINSKTGDVKIESINLKKNSIIKSNTGDIKIKSTKGCYIDATSNVGDKSIKQNDRKSDIVLTIKNNIGDIDVN